MKNLKFKELSTSTKVLLFITGGTILISIILILMMTFNSGSNNSKNINVNSNTEYSVSPGNNPFGN